jgi:hypothetical protein
VAHLDPFISAITSPTATWVLFALGGISVAGLGGLVPAGRRWRSSNQGQVLSFVGVVLFVVLVFVIVSLITQKGILDAAR